MVYLLVALYFPPTGGPQWEVTKTFQAMAECKQEKHRIYTTEDTRTNMQCVRVRTNAHAQLEPRH